MHRLSARTKLNFFFIFLLLLIWVRAIHFFKPSSTPHNLKSSPTDRQLGTIIQHLPFACFEHGISQDKDFNPHMRNPVTYEFSSSTYRKSWFHGLRLGASPRALLCFQLWLKAFSEGSSSRRGTQTALMSTIFTLWPGQQEQSSRESICSASEGFQPAAESGPCLHFSTISCHGASPPRRSIIRHQAYKVKHSFPAPVLAIPMRYWNPKLQQEWGCCTATRPVGFVSAVT